MKLTALILCACLAFKASSQEVTSSSSAQQVSLQLKSWSLINNTHTDGPMIHSSKGWLMQKETQSTLLDLQGFCLIPAGNLFITSSISTRSAQKQPVTYYTVSPL